MTIEKDRRRFAVVECPSYGDAWSMCRYDLPSHYEHRSTLVGCMRFIAYNAYDAFDYVVVRLHLDDTFSEADIVWTPCDYDSDEFVSHYRRKRGEYAL
jgi:hypothetical protein